MASATYPPRMLAHATHAKKQAIEMEDPTDAGAAAQLNDNGVGGRAKPLIKLR